MALSEKQVIDKIEVVGDYKHVQVRVATIIEKDGVEISRTFHRHVVSPGDDYSDESLDVQKICKAMHIKSVIDAYLAAQNADSVQ